MKELILLNESNNLRLLDIVGSLMKSFKLLTHSLSGFTIRDVMILIHPKIRYEYVSRLQIVLDFLFVIVTSIGFWFVFCDTISNNLQLELLVGYNIPHIPVHRLDMNAHAFFPIVIVFIVKYWFSNIFPLRLLTCHINSSGDKLIAKRPSS